MSNYEYANGTGLSVLSQQIFEHLTPLVESVKVFFLASYDRENPPKIGKYIENEDGNSIWATEDNAMFAMEPWSDTPPERLPGMYLWTYTEAIFKDGSIYNSDPVCLVTWDDIDNAVNGMTASLETGLALKADKATTYTKTEVDNFVDTGTVTSEAENPLVIETDAAQYAKKTHLTLAPVQDLHGYDRPWPAGGGKNFADYSAEHSSSIGNTYTFNEYDGWIKEEWASGGKHQLVLSVPFVERLRGNKITISITSADISNQRMSDWRIFLLTYINGGSESIVATLNPATNLRSTITLNDNITEMRILLRMSQSGTASLVAGDNIVFHGLQLEVSESPTSYEPYSNICPITGVDEVEVRVTGFNQWDEEWEVGNIDPASGQNYSQNNVIRIKNYISVKSGATYNIHAPWVRVFYYDMNKNYISYADPTSITEGFANYTITIPNDVAYMRFRCAVYYGTTYNHDICINISDAEKNGTYEPYTESVTSIDLPEPVYSGTLDLETGEVVADRRTKRLTTGGWGTSNNIVYTTLVGQGMTDAYLPSSGVNANVVSNVGIGATWAGAQSIDYGVAISYDGYIGISNKIYNALINGDPVDVCYKLATPKTYQLTPQQLALFKGINNISTNAKTVQVTYRNGELATTGDIVASTEVAKQNAIGESASYTDARLATELAPILGDLATAETSPASASHAVGEYLLYNNRLYKVLAAISAGQQLTIGTNVGQTNVAAELASLGNAATHFISDANETSGTQSNLIDVIVNTMTVNGFYQIKGTYTNHSYGYTAIGWRVSYANEPRYAGVIICHDGNVIAFSKQGTSAAVIKVLATP